jgi:hypothetical protein
MGVGFVWGKRLKGGGIEEGDVVVVSVYIYAFGGVWRYGSSTA